MTTRWLIYIGGCECNNLDIWQTDHSNLIYRGRPTIYITIRRAAFEVCFMMLKAC